MKRLLFACLLLAGISTTYAQSEEELKAALAEKNDSIASIQGRADAIQAQIDALPGWKIGAFGVIGGNISNFSDWYAQGFGCRG